VREGKTLEQRADLVPFPQVLLGVPVKEKRPLEELPELSRALRSAESRLGEAGRVVVRYSGTENLLRIMVEAAEASTAEKLAADLAGIAQRLLG
jgi:phosphoglucosamine mutase